jgi:hypothetical protein
MKMPPRVMSAQLTISMGKKQALGLIRREPSPNLIWGIIAEKSRTVSSPYRSIFMVSSGSARLWIADTAIAEHDRELATWTPLHTAKRPRSFVIEKLDIAFRE